MKAKDMLIVSKENMRGSLEKCLDDMMKTAKQGFTGLVLHIPSKECQEELKKLGYSLEGVFADEDNSFIVSWENADV